VVSGQRSEVEGREPEVAGRAAEKRGAKSDGVTSDPSPRSAAGTSPGREPGDDDSVMRARPRSRRQGRGPVDHRTTQETQ